MSADDKTRILPQVTEAGVGTQLSGIYELDERIASGGMGEVYRGHNIQTDDLVAIKIVLTEFARDPTILSLFKKEASVLNHLAHDAIVRYHVFTVDPGIGRPYLAMEYVHGESLVDLMRKGPMSPEDAAKLCARLASGLSAAHEAGVVHRDLSPDNIILPGGRVDRAKIIDFGIARSAAVGGETLIGGKFAGKYNYVSPEQLGLFGGEVSEQSDIYSLGLVLAAALRAEPLDMSGSQVEIIEKRRTVPDLSAVDPSIRPVLAAMLQPDPARRPRGMAAVAEMANAARTTLTQPPEARPGREDTMVGGPRDITSPPWAEPQSPGPTAPPATALPQASATPDTAAAQPERPADFVEHRRPAFLDAAPPAAPAAASAAPPRRTGRVVAIAASLLVVAAGGAYVAGIFEPASAPAPQASNAPTSETTAPAQPAIPAEPESAAAPASEPPAENTAAATPDAAPAGAEADPAQAEATPPPSEPAPSAEPAPQPQAAETPATEPEPAAKASPPAPQPAETAAAPDPAPETTPPAVAEAQPVQPAPEQPLEPEQPQATQAQPAPTADKDQSPAAEQQVSRAEPTSPAQPQPAPSEQPAAAEPQTPAAPEAAAPVEAPATPPAAPAETATPSPQPLPQPEPAQPEPQVTAKLDNVAERISWLRSYTGGQCFYATTTSATDTATEIEGFGTTVEPFMQLLQSFQTRFNMEPDVGVRLIEPAQCVVADFLRDLPRSSANPPELTLDRTTIPNGTPVSGRLGEIEGRKTELILIDHKGMAFNLNSRLTLNGSRAAFSIPIGLSASDQAAKKVVPQVIIALTSPSGIRAAEFINPVPAKELLPKVLDEIRATGSDGTATAKYFRLGG